VTAQHALLVTAIPVAVPTAHVVMTTVQHAPGHAMTAPKLAMTAAQVVVRIVVTTAHVVAAQTVLVVATLTATVMTVVQRVANQPAILISASTHKIRSFRTTSLVKSSIVQYAMNFAHFQMV
jgi:hypothetical protein